MTIDKTAKIDSSVEIAENVTIGPYVIIHPGVKIGKGCKVAAHAVIYPDTTLGENNTIHSFACIGSDPQVGHKKSKTFGSLEVGEGNVFHEFVTISRGCKGGKTQIGNHNLFQAYAHVGHDCHIKNHTIMVSQSGLAGHVMVEDYAITGGFTSVHQFCKVGESSMTAHGAIITNDVMPYIIIANNPPTPYGLNSVGLRRRGFSDEVRSNLKKAYKVIFRQKLPIADAVQALKGLAENCPKVTHMVEFMQESQRGITR